MGDARQLLDRFWDFHVEADDHMPLWDSQIEQMERWPSSSLEHTAGIRDGMLRLREESLDLMAGAGDLGPSVQTAADAALLQATTRDIEVELSLPHPSIGLHSYFYWAVNNFPLRTDEHGDRYLDKLARFPDAVDELRTRLEEAAAQGRTQLARHNDEAAQKLRAHLDSPIADDPLMQQQAPTEISEEAARRWRDDLGDAIEANVRPALGRLRETLVGLLPQSRSDEAAGLLHLPGGAQSYAELLEGYTAPGLSAQDIHDTGLAQVERLADEYRELGGGALGTTDLAEILTRLREDESLHYDTAEAVVEAATQLHEKARTEAPRWFHRTPKSSCEVRAVEHGSIAFYSRPAKDGSRPAFFFFNTSDPTIWGPSLAPTVFHEGIPGHHFQLALAMEDDGLHDLHRNLYLPAFGEGWALYAERFADEIGLYRDDIDRLGMLATDSMRACRLVVDTGMHALGWSRRQAIDYMLTNSPLGEVEITAEVDRYIGMPGQATSYMMGRLEIQRLRESSAEQLGDAFDLPTFHDVVLSRGIVSLPALRMSVDAWVGGRSGS